MHIARNVYNIIFILVYSLRWVDFAVDSKQYFLAHFNERTFKKLLLQQKWSGKLYQEIYVVLKRYWSFTRILSDRLEIRSLKIWLKIKYKNSPNIQN